MSEHQQEVTGRQSVRLPLVWMWLSVAAAVLALVGSVVGLVNPTTAYGRETELLFNTAIAQDLVNGLLVAPLIVVLAVLARRGALGSWLVLVGFTLSSTDPFTWNWSYPARGVRPMG